MKRNIFLFFTLLTVSSGTGLSGINSEMLIKICSDITEQDTINERQLLYNGIVWRNRYRRMEGDQFLFSGFFLPSTVSINGRTFKNVRLKYDIYSDEIITPVNRDDILQLNKEMVDSFTITFENKVYRFINAGKDTIAGFTGYFNLLYKGESAFYVKYKKSLSIESTQTSDGHFIQNQMILLVKDKMTYPINGTKALFRVLNSDKGNIKNFIKKNKLRVSKKIPESYVPVIRFYDSIRK
jgi:hypothetical protein